MRLTYMLPVLHPNKTPTELSDWNSSRIERGDEVGRSTEEINGGEENRRECIARATSKEKASKESEEEGSETE
jgi:hypothetical protein